MPSPLIVLTAVAAQGLDAVISTAELCRALQAQQQSLNGKAVRYEVSVYHGKGAPCMPGSGPPADSLLWTDRWEVVRMDRNFRIVRETIAASEVDTVGERLVRTWNGIEGRDKGYLRSGSPNVLAIQDVAIHDPRAWDHSMTWLGWWVLESPRGESLLDLLQRPGIIGPEHCRDGRTRWRFDLDPMPTETSIYARRTDSGVELCEIEVSNYHDHSRSDQALMGRSRWKFAPICHERGEVLSANVDVQICAWSRNDPSHQSWGFSRIVLDKITTVDITPTTFREPAGDCKTVLDKRYRISYDQGSRFINVDGRTLCTHVPVLGDDVGNNLEWWVENGQWWDPAADAEVVGDTSNGEDIQ